MNEIAPVFKTPLKIFIASASEMEQERTTSRLIFDGLNDTHDHLFIRGFDWKYNMPHDNNPGYDNIQSAITDKYLQDAPAVVFIFYSRIGTHTLAEFEYAMANNKRVFIYFKDGFTPTIETFDEFGELLQFQKSLNETVLYEKYKDINEFKLLLSNNLSLYINQTAALASPDKQTAQELKEQLAQQEKIRKELEEQLSTQSANDALKAQALEEVKKGDYDAAEEHLMQSAEQDFHKVASTFFELFNIKKLKLQYKEAYEFINRALLLDPQNNTYLHNAGQMANTLGLYDASMDYHQKSLAVCISLYGEENADTATSNNEIGFAYYSKGAYDKAIEYYEKALVLGKKFLGEEHPKIATRYNNLGAAYRAKGEYDKAIEYYEKALVIDKKFYGEEHPDIATDYNNLGIAYDSKGAYDKAIEYYEKALVIDKKFYGEEHPNIAIRYNNLGSAYYSKGAYDKAIEYYDKALVILKKIHGENHPYIGSSYNNLGGAYDSKGDYDKAIEYYDKALVIDKKFHGEEHPKIATRYNNLGAAYRAKGEYDKAIEYYEIALVIDKKFYGEEHPDIATYYNNLGSAYDSKGEYDKAIEYYEKALAINKKFLPPTHPYIQTTTKNLQAARAALAASKK